MNTITKRRRHLTRAFKRLSRASRNLEAASYMFERSDCHDLMDVYRALEDARGHLNYVRRELNDREHGVVR